MGTYFLAGQKLEASPLSAGLYIVATPIGNLRDMTVRALETLAAAELVACEDSRVSAKLLRHYGIDRPLLPYHEHNAARSSPKIMELLRRGKPVALISDAGTPLISDPGYRLVRDARAAGIAVYPVPGASSVMAALSVAGLPTDRFLFAGFLPSKQGARRRELELLARETSTIVVFESPNRLAASLADMAATLGARRQIRICRELTKLHEEVAAGEAGALAEQWAQRTVRGEIVIVIEPAPQSQAEHDIDALLQESLASESVSRAAGRVAELTGLRKRDLYHRALQLAQSDGERDGDGDV